MMRFVVLIAIVFAAVAMTACSDNTSAISDRGDIDSGPSSPLPPLHGDAGLSEGSDASSATVDATVPAVPDGAVVDASASDAMATDADVTMPAPIDAQPTDAEPGDELPDSGPDLYGVSGCWITFTDSGSTQFDFVEVADGSVTGTQSYMEYRYPVDNGSIDDSGFVFSVYWSDFDFTCDYVFNDVSSDMMSGVATCGGSAQDITADRSCP